jgi:DNA-binding transcriptional regulator YiaG
VRKLEALRLRYGMTKTELAAELGANVDGVSAWMAARTIRRKETVTLPRSDRGEMIWFYEPEPA